MKNNLLSAFISALILQGAAFAEAPKTGVLDLNRVFAEYSAVQEASKIVGQKEELMMRLLQTAETEVKALRADTKVKPVDVDAKQAEIQALVDTKVQELNTLKNNYDAQFKEQIKATIVTIVQEKGLSLVLDKAFVTEGGFDITTEFLAKLESARKK